ncbi:ferrous iron transport protein A [Mycoplasmatota bacterium]|nr:ferrous iron transport protein A [Mycoplasmatota bacterium]
MLLSDLEIGESAVISDMSKIDKSFRNRLMDIGIYRGARVLLVNKMSFGKMLVVEVDDVEICIRRTDAERIEVR